MDKVFKAIGRFFKKIWEWIRQTAWIQPLLIVAIIFGIIFSINPIVNAIKDAVNSDDTGEFYKAHKATFRDLFSGIENQSPSYDKKTKFEISNKTGDCLVIYVSDNSLEKDVASFYKSAAAKGIKLYIVDFSRDVNKESKWDTSEKDYVDDDGANYYNYLVQQFQQKYDGESDNNYWRTTYQKAFQSQYGYSCFYSDFNDDDTFKMSSTGASNAKSDLRLPIAVKYHDGAVQDFRFASNNTWTGYVTNASQATNFQVLSDMWNGPSAEKLAEFANA